MGEIIFVVLLAGGFFIPVILARQWWLAKVFGLFFVCFGLVEWWAVSSTGMSVSQHFWEYSLDHKAGAWGVMGGMAVAWLALLVHLGKNIFKKRD